MKLIYTFSIFALSCFSLLAQSPGYVWGRGAGSTIADEGNAVATDASGNVLVTGFYTSSTLAIGAYSLSHGSGNGAVFVAKYDASGNVLWAKSAGQTSNDKGQGIATDASGNVYVTGFFTGPSITFGSYTLTNSFSNKSDVFVVKYDPSGNVLWAKRYGDSNNDYAYGVATDAGGNAFVTGVISGGAVVFGTYTVTNTDGLDMFVLKLDPSGNEQWVRRSNGGNQPAYGNSIATDPSGNSVVTGYYGNTTLNCGTFTVTNNGAAGTADIFVVKYDPSGNELFLKSDGGTGNEYGNGVSTDAGGNIIVVGDFNSSTFAAGTTTLSVAGFNDGFVIKYDPSGNVLWAKGHSGSSIDAAKDVCTEASGNIYVCGTFASSPLTVGSTTITTAGIYDIYAVKYDPNGNVIWVKREGSGGSDYGTSIAVNSTGNAIVTGNFGSVSLALGSTTLTCQGGSDFYVFELGNSVGINEFTNIENGIRLYPNPSTGIFSLKTKTEISTVEITNVLGEIIYSSTDLSSNSIDISGRPKGIYFIRGEDKNKIIFSGKIILE